MDSNSMKHLLQDARAEIVGLRKSNEILAAQVGVIEVFAVALGMRRGESGASPDVAWALQRKIDEMEAIRTDSATGKAA